MTQRETASYKYINPETETIFYISRFLWFWSYAIQYGFIQNRKPFPCNEYFDTRRECKQEIERQYGKITAYSTYIRRQHAE